MKQMLFTWVVLLAIKQDRTILTKGCSTRLAQSREPLSMGIVAVIEGIRHALKYSN